MEFDKGITHFEHARVEGWVMDNGQAITICFRIFNIGIINNFFKRKNYNLKMSYIKELGML